LGTDTLDRLLRAVTLDATLFREVAEDARATGPALVVVMATAFAEGLGRLFGEGLTGLLAGVGRGCLVWGFWLLGVHATALVLGLPSDLAKLFRVLGFAAVAFGLAVFEGLPLLGVLFSLAKWALVFAAFVTGVRALFEIEMARAALVCGCGFLVVIVLSIPATWLFPG
jgi:hypothetical protein